MLHPQIIRFDITKALLAVNGIACVCVCQDGVSIARLIELTLREGILMKKSLTIKGLLVLGILLAFTGCGGGGGGNDASAPIPTDPDQEFSLSTIKSTAPGTVYSTQLTGTDSEGGQWTGSLSIANRAQVMLDGVLVTPQESIISLNFDGNTAASGGASYIDMSGFILGRREQDGTICTPAFPYQLPDVVKIGDFGFAPTETCSDNSSSESSWRVEDAGNGNINFITSVEINDGTGGIGSTTITLNSAGNILAFKIVVSGSNIPTISLQSN